MSSVISKYRYDNNGGKVTIRSEPRMFTDFYNAGIKKGDRILKLDENEVTDDSTLISIIGSLQVGKVYDVEYEQDRRQRKSTFRLLQDPAFELRWMKNKEVDRHIDARRRAWLQIN